MDGPDRGHRLRSLDGAGQGDDLRLPPHGLGRVHGSEGQGCGNGQGHRDPGSNTWHSGLPVVTQVCAIVT